MEMRLSQQRWALRASSVAAVAVSAEAFSVAPALPRASPALARASLLPGARRTVLAPAAARGSRSLLMAGAGGKAVELDSAGFDMGDADPIGSIAELDKAVPRSAITALIKQTSDAQGFRQILWQACCYAVCAAAFAASQAAAFVPAMALSMLGMAFVMAFNFMALHETVHRSAFKSRIWNDVFMQVAGLLTLRPALHYFYYHWAHHKFTGDPEKDSELIPSPLDMDVTTITGYFLYVSGLPFWFDAVTSTVKHAMGICPEHYLSAAKAKKEITTEARIYCAFYLALAAAAVLNPAFGAGLLTYVVLPSVLGQPFLRFYLMAEHRGCAESTNVLENTRTMETNWLIRQMAWQMPYHLEHHAWPYVPFHKLAEANKLVVASGGWSKDSCAPTGEQGYVGLNQKVVQKLFIKATK